MNMPVITFMPSGMTFDVKPKTNLIAAIINAKMPIGSSCGALGVCAKCFVKVIKGMENLSKPNPVELKLLEKEKFGPDIRISCQTKVLGDVTITTGYW